MTNDERVKELIPQPENKLDGYEAILNRQKHLGGNVRSSYPRNMPKSCRSDELLAAPYVKRPDYEPHFRIKVSV